MRIEWPELKMYVVRLEVIVRSGHCLIFLRVESKLEEMARIS